MKLYTNYNYFAAPELSELEREVVEYILSIKTSVSCAYPN